MLIKYEISVNLSVETFAYVYYNFTYFTKRCKNRKKMYENDRKVMYITFMLLENSIKAFAGKLSLGEAAYKKGRSV